MSEQTEAIMIALEEYLGTRGHGVYCQLHDEMECTCGFEKAVAELAQLRAQLAAAQAEVEEARKVIEQDKSAMGRILLITGLENGDRRKQILDAYECDAAWLAEEEK